ncbi:MAG: glycine--tRNA ligase [Chloroflexi bacterium]|nr:glycine--tRNA ligase [Chloroflexota bacterium]
MNEIVSLCKRRGIIFPSSEIYGGLGSTWDYGPLGVELKRNVKDAWWKAVVQEREDMVGLDAAILMHPKTWEASGHLESFTDPLVECRFCNQRFRADQIWRVEFVGQDGKPVHRTTLGTSQKEVIESFREEARRHQPNGLFSVKGLTELTEEDYRTLRCPSCDSVDSLTKSRMFNLMFKTFMGPVEDEASQIYLRPETAQGIFVNFENVLNSSRRKMPFGIAQIGKSFRNEITPGNFTFRSREFEQMEIEYFVKPGTDEEQLKSWVEERFQWYINLGIKRENLRIRPHGKEELAHYAKACYDIEYSFPMGWSELEGIANRSDYDLKQHTQYSGRDLSYFDEETGERYVPYVIEPSGGVDRAILAFLVDAYYQEEVRGETRVILRLHKALAPVKVAVLPLSRNEKLLPMSQEVYKSLKRHWMVSYDDAQSIGRRYRRQDEIGTPLCVTIDFQSLEDKAVTIRDRDSMEQIRVRVEELKDVLHQKLSEE